MIRANSCTPLIGGSRKRCVFKKKKKKSRFANGRRFGYKNELTLCCPGELYSINIEKCVGKERTTLTGDTTKAIMTANAKEVVNMPVCTVTVAKWLIIHKTRIITCV